MPTITRLQDLDKPKSSNKPQPDSPNEWASRCYNTLRWRKLREAKLQDSPLCEMCSMYEKVTPATCVHHIHNIADAGSYLEAMDIAFDSNNLMSLCDECHQRYHAISHHVGGTSKEDLLFLEKYKSLCRKKYGNQ